MPSTSADEQKRAHALREARTEMKSKARAGDDITYTELADRLTTKYAPNGTAFSELLSDVSRTSFGSKKVLLSAVVVHADDRLPGNGFFTLAQELGLSVNDRKAFWERAVADVYAAYSDAEPD